MLRHEYAKIIPFDRLTLYYVEYDLESVKYLRETEWVLCRNDFIVNKVEQKDNIRVIKFSENYRFKFKFNKINREIEYFKTGSEDFFDIVARFHLPCVRAYYQGDNVYMLPSCITAMMTGINIEYKYFAGIRDPVDIINKYNRRGFGIILNSTELEQYKKFNESSDRFKVGTKSVYDPIFAQIDTDTQVEYKYLKTEKDIQEIYDRQNENVNVFITGNNNLLNTLNTNYKYAYFKNSGTFIAIDNWSQFNYQQDIKGEFVSNIDTYKNKDCTQDVSYIAEDSWKVDITTLPKFNIYMYDGDHEAIDHYNALKYYLNTLDETFIYIVDDWNWEDVRNGTYKSISKLNLKIFIFKIF